VPCPDGPVFQGPTAPGRSDTVGYRASTHSSGDGWWERCGHGTLVLEGSADGTNWTPLDFAHTVKGPGWAASASVSRPCVDDWTYRATYFTDARVAGHPSYKGSTAASSCPPPPRDGGGYKGGR